MLKRVEPVMVFLIDKTSHRSHDKIPVSNLHNFLPLTLPFFCSQIFLELDESVSVKVISLCV